MLPYILLKYIVFYKVIVLISVIALRSQAIISLTAENRART